NDRGYTGHEHLDDVGLIHMNGRIFDPTLGRFMQTDPFVQDPGNLQNFDRYAYCYNSPTTCTDPSGYFLKWLERKIRREWKRSELFRSVVSIAVAWYLGPGGGLASITSNTVAQSAIAGFASGAISSGSLEGALQGAFTAGAFAGVGNVIQGGEFFAGGGTSGSLAGVGNSKLAAVALHGVVGCVTSVAGGGKCGPGALSAAFSKGAGLNGLQAEGPAGILTSAVIGGTASVLGGGKFANGAQTAAFGYIYNWAMHVHGTITADALRSEGIGDKAGELAKAVALTDMNPSWSESQSPANAVWHGMCAGGDSAALCDLKKLDYLNGQWEARSPEGFARLAHAIQDYEAPMHGGKSYSGFATKTEAMVHALSDLRPPPAEYDRLVQRTKQLFRDYNSHCSGCLK
uniref:RHS repeat-associated core domain-containing protein n=1 Tax=Variovorax sp. YR752 TaxID=1884383 RepID=UPI00313810AD